MSFRDILNKLDPRNIIYYFQNKKDMKQIMLLCEKNPSGISEFIGGFGYGLHSIEGIIEGIEQIRKAGKDVDINEMISTLLKSSNDSTIQYNHSAEKLTNYALNNGLDVDASLLKANPNLMKDCNIAKYIYSKGELEPYEFCQMHRPDFSNIDEIVKKDIRCIEFDLTNNPNTYEYVIDELSKIIEQDMQRRYEKGKLDEFSKQRYSELLGNLKKSREIINYKREKKEGKYYFPEAEMFQNIREITKKYTTMKNPELLPSEELRALNKPFEAFYARDGFFDKDFGEIIERIYYDDSTVLGVHNTDGLNYTYTDENIKSFFNKGLCNLANNTTITGNVNLQENFLGQKQTLAELLYWKWDMEGRYNIIFQFPKNLVLAENDNRTSPLIESVLDSDGNVRSTYIPPKYIVGAYDRENPHATIIKNDIFYNSDKITDDRVITSLNEE